MSSIVISVAELWSAWENSAVRICFCDNRTVSKLSITYNLFQREV